MRASFPKTPLLKTRILSIALLLLFCGGGPLAQTPKPPEGGATNSPERQIGIRPAPTPPPAAPAEKRTALVIGNSAYAQGPLKNPVNDAKAMAKALRECGFDVILKTDCNLEEMEAAVADFGKRIRAGGAAALFYYAGHGIQVDGRNYLVPVGVDVDAENKVKFRCLDSGLALAEMENAANRVSIVILDACRNNPFARSWRSSNRGLAVMEAATGTVIAYSTAPGKVASDGDGDNSVYTESLLKHIRTPVSILDVFTNVRRDVMLASKKAQTPWEVTSLTGKFYLTQPDASILPGNMGGWVEPAPGQPATRERVEDKVTGAALAGKGEPKELPFGNVAMFLAVLCVVLVAVVFVWFMRGKPSLAPAGRGPGVSPRASVEPRPFSAPQAAATAPRATQEIHKKEDRPPGPALPGKGNTGARLALDELDAELQKRAYPLEKRISYYQEFLKDYAGTTAAEATRSRISTLEKLRILAEEAKRAYSELESQEIREVLTKTQAGARRDGWAGYLSKYRKAGWKAAEAQQKVSYYEKWTPGGDLGRAGSKAGEVVSADLGGGMKMDLVWVPSGSFQMGSPSSESGRSDDEGPVHTVELDGFWMGKYEVTQEQYQAVMEKNPSNFKGVKNPVEQVSWNDATDFCRKLTDKVGRASSPAKSFRLPTEAEWEYACRAGSTTRFCFGDSDGGLGDYAWYDGNSGSKTHPVGEKKANEWGLYDMHGNVWEWCGDWYADKYCAGSAKNPTGPSSGSYRVFRGGCWYGPASYCRSADRGRFDPGGTINGLGFRAVVPAVR